MKPPNTEADKLIEKRMKVHEIGQLRRERMIVMRVGDAEDPTKINLVKARKQKNYFGVH